MKHSQEGHKLFHAALTAATLTSAAPSQQKKKHNNNNKKKTQESILSRRATHGSWHWWILTSIALYYQPCPAHVQYINLTSGRSVRRRPPPATVRASFTAATGPDEKKQGQRHFSERVILKNHYTPWGKKKHDVSSTVLVKTEVSSRKRLQPQPLFVIHSRLIDSWVKWTLVMAYYMDIELNP